MTSTDYLLNGALIALVILQIRGRRLTARTLMLPVLIVAYAAHEYLHSIPTAGNDVVLAIAGAGLGLAFGIGAGLNTRVFRRNDGSIISKAGVAAAILWITGVGARMAFSLYTSHGGGATIERFSSAHQITSMDAWIACLMLMAIAEVLSRTAIIAFRFRKITSQDASNNEQVARTRSKIEFGGNWS